MLRVVIHVIAKIFITCLFVFISIEIIDFDSFTMISDFDKLSIKVNTNSGKFYFAPKNKNDLYYYMACSGNKWWSNLDVKNDSIKADNICPGSLFLVEGRADAVIYYDMIFDKDVKCYALKPRTTDIFSMTEYILYQVLKSILLFIAFCASLISTDIAVRRISKPFFYFNIVISLIISIYFIFFYSFGYFYSYLFFNVTPSI